VNPNRLILFVLIAAGVALAATVTALQGSTGLVHLALDAGPFLLVVGVLLKGRFVGEERILARRRRARVAHRRPARRAWSRQRDRALASLLERRPRQLRGPPGPLAA
jgi:hypothetical protein